MHRLAVVSSHLPAERRAACGASGELEKQLRECKQELREFINEHNCHPIMIRLAWHDSGTFDKDGGAFPKCGGANGSIRFSQELKHGANAGLSKAIGYVEQVSEQFPLVSKADVIQMASAVAVELAGGPVIPMRYGRVDTREERECPAEGNLPGAGAPFGDGSSSAGEHLRKVFYRMGFNDQEIVALSGAHTLGRAFKGRSGTVQEGFGNKSATKFTHATSVARADGAKGVGMPGGRSWTPNWLTFDNSYFHQDRRAGADQKSLLWLETDRVLQTDPGFAPHYQRYGRDKEAFFADYAKVHAKLSELGSQFNPPQGIRV